MKKSILILFLVGIYQIGFSQKTELNYCYYNQVITDLKANDKNSVYYDELNYYALIFFDSDLYPFLDTIKPKQLHLIKPEKYETTDEFKVEINKITDFFENDELFKEIIFSLSKESKYDLKDIYIGETNKAYFTISSTDTDEYYWSNSYGIILENGFIKVKDKYLTIE